MKKRIVSPCVDICQLRRGDQFCRGCYRSLDEIARWSTMSDRERSTIMSELAVRKDAPTL